MQYVPRHRQGQELAQEMKDYTNSQICGIIDEHIHDKRARAILKMRLCDHCTYEEIAEAVDRSVRQVGYTLNKFIPVIFKNL